VRDSCFGPVIANVALGTELRWKNWGQMPHNIVELGNTRAGMKMLNAGASTSMTFDKPGAFLYYCAMHPGMMGAVFVSEAGSDGEPLTQTSAVDVSLDSSKAVQASQPEASSGMAATREGIATQTVLALALAIGTVAGGGSTLLVRRLDRNGGPDGT
jgi:hypothetical protein